MINTYLCVSEINDDKTMSILMMYTNILAYIISSILHLASTGLTSRISRDRLLFPYNEHHNIINTQHMRKFNLPFSCMHGDKEHKY